MFARDVGGRARVLWGTCEALFTPRPLGPFYDVVYALGGPLAARLEHDAKPADLFHALLEALREHEQPSVLVLEDVHWADHATLDFIRFLARRIARLPAMLVCTYRDDEVGPSHPLTKVLGEKPPSEQSMLKLPALTRETVDRLARESGRTDIDVFRITAGNPFFVSEVIVARGDAVAPTARQAVLARAGRRSNPARELLDLVSVVPDRLELALLERPLRGDLEALEECAERGLLVLGEGHVSFKHELARIAIEGALSPVKRTRLNRALVEALASMAATSATPSFDLHHKLPVPQASAARSTKPPGYSTVLFPMWTDYRWKSRPPCSNAAPAPRSSSGRATPQWRFISVHSTYGSRCEKTQPWQRICSIGAKSSLRAISTVARKFKRWPMRLSVCSDSMGRVRRLRLQCCGRASPSPDAIRSGHVPSSAKPSPSARQQRRPLHWSRFFIVLGIWKWSS